MTEGSMSRSQRISVATPWLSPTESTVLTRFAEQVRAQYGGRVNRIALFGSRARREGHEESDLDVAVILADVDQALRRALIDLATDLFLETEMRISPLVLSQDEFDTLLRLGRGVAIAIRDEGIDL
ncbi:MAG: nucleotidyltransferase domain-containing protein [Nitrospirota bacterium]